MLILVCHFLILVLARRGGGSRSGGKPSSSRGSWGKTGSSWNGTASNRGYPHVGSSKCSTIIYEELKAYFLTGKDGFYSSQNQRCPLQEAVDWDIVVPLAMDYFTYNDLLERDYFYPDDLDYHLWRPIIEKGEKGFNLFRYKSMNRGCSNAGDYSDDPVRSYFRAGWLSNQTISNRVARESWNYQDGRVRVYEFAGPNIKGRCGQPEPQYVIQIYPGKNFSTADYFSFGEQEMLIYKSPLYKNNKPEYVYGGCPRFDDEESGIDSIMSSGPSYFDWLSQANSVSEASFLGLLRKMFFFRTDVEDKWQITMKMKSLFLTQFTTKIFGVTSSFQRNFWETVLYRHEYPTPCWFTWWKYPVTVNNYDDLYSYLAANPKNARYFGFIIESNIPKNEKEHLIQEWEEHMTCPMTCKITRPIIGANEKLLDVLEDLWEEIEDELF